MIALMSRVELVCLRSIRAELVRNLQERGLLHLDEVSTEVEGAEDFLNKVVLEGEERDAMLAAEDAQRALAEVAPLLTVQPGAGAVSESAAQLESLEEADLFEQVKGWTEELRETTRKRLNEQDQLEVLNNYRTVIQQVAPSLGADVKLGKGTRALVLTGDVDRAAARIDERFEKEFENNYAFYKHMASKKQLVGLLTFPEDHALLVNKILNQEGVAPMDMSDAGYTDLTASELLAKIEETISALTTDVASLKEEADSISSSVGANIVAARALVGDAVARMHVSDNFAESEMVAVIQGWTPSEQFGELSKAIEADFPGQVDVNEIAPDDPHHPNAPTQLRNNKWVKPFEVVMGIFKPPAYGTIDPTSMVAVSFILFYGFILGDACYAVGLFLLALLLNKKLGHIPAVKDVVTIAKYMAASAFVFGVAFGEYFGNFVEKWLWPKLFGSEFHLYLFHRALEPNDTLKIGIYIGIVHILLGLALGVKEDFRHGHKTHAIEKLGMWLCIVAVIQQVFSFFEHPVFGAAFLTPVSMVMGIAGVILLFYSMGLMGMIGIIEVLSLGGNILSYGRLMALGFASIALADIANMLPGMFGGGSVNLGYVIGIFGAFAVHVLNIGIGIASPTIHSLRLNFVEFLPKFYAPEGKGYAPFKKEKVS